MNINHLEDKALWLRQECWNMVMRQRKGHIPSSYSCVEIIVALYYGGVARLTRGRPDAPNRDRIIVSKGHAAAVQYPVLADLDYFDKRELKRYTQPGGLLGMYADYKIPGIEGISGSLGHGVGMGSGFAFAAKQNNEDYRTFVVLGDGECYEGSIWESAMFAAHHNLDNLVAIVDRNDLCILGRTKELLDLGDLEGKWQSFGWKAITVNGHSFEELLDALSLIGTTSGKPLAIIANTVKGKGISFMEGRPEWHNRIPDEEQMKVALGELGLKTMAET
ncbi:transketolase [Rhodospirillales bacterium]|nr:transketolase [Rhodospirillales bacterium]